LVACQKVKATTALAPPSGEVRVEVTDVGYDKASASHYVQLEDRASRRSLQIVIGDDEAQAITLELRGLQSPRPLATELLREVIARTGNEVDRVDVTEVRDDVYYAKVFLDGGRYAIDSRPSDAIALAMGASAPIYVATDLMQAENAAPIAGVAPVTATNFGITVEQLTPDLASYFGVAATSGVVVADVDHAASVAGLQRGDILIDAGGRAIDRPDDFAHATHAVGAPIGLTVRHGVATRTITISPKVTAGAP
jgi:bifunctional DNase/RNase